MRIQFEILINVRKQRTDRDYLIDIQSDQWGRSMPSSTVNVLLSDFRIR